MAEPGLTNEGAVPELMTHDLEVTGGFWRLLGFAVEAEAEAGDGRLTVTRGAASLRYVLLPTMDVRTTQCVAFVKTDDVDALHAEIAATGLWRSDAAATDDHDDGFTERLAAGSGIARVAAPVDRAWGMREVRLFDPSNNLVRIAQDVGPGEV